MPSCSYKEKSEKAQIHSSRRLHRGVYNRIWNSEVTAFLLRVNECFDNRLAPPFSWMNDRGNGGNGGNGNKTGTGLYASDHDMFAFLVDSDKAIDGISGSELVRGFYIYNNEVGSRLTRIVRVSLRHESVETISSGA